MKRYAMTGAGLLLTAALSGCVAVPPPGAAPYAAYPEPVYAAPAPVYYRPAYYGPSYYAGPSFSFSYSNWHGGGYRGGYRHWH
jgi:hypothetical protein